MGKEKNGSLQPLLLEVKLDKKGLVANEDVRIAIDFFFVRKFFHFPSHFIQNSQSNVPKRRKPMNVAQATQNMESKHPVSLLGELSAKRKWQMPKYDLVCEAGPHHNRQFLFTVILTFRWNERAGVTRTIYFVELGRNERYGVSTTEC